MADDLRSCKRLLRREVLAAAARIPPEERERSGIRIAERLCSLPAWHTAGTVACFVGTARELDTRPILEAALDAGKRLCVPLCVGKGVMEMRRVAALTDLSPGAMGILEPGRDSETIPPGEIDLLIVPCVTCDRHGNRLGYGGGYYDRYLSEFHGNAVLLCREALLREHIPVEAQDVPVRPVLTEWGVY